MQRIVIFGATSTIASACARLWTSKGCHLFLIGRNKDKLSSLVDDLSVRASDGQLIKSIVADLNQLDRHEEIINTAEKIIGPPDIIFIAYGSLPDQEFCQSSASKTCSEIMTNFTSIVSLLTYSANRLEQEKQGVIAVISSVAGDRGRKNNYIYGAAKGGLTIFLQGLRNRLYTTGIHVITIKPGFVDTQMTARFVKKSILWARPEGIATGIIQAIEKRKDVVYLPLFWRFIMLVIQNIPEYLFKRLSI